MGEFLLKSANVIFALVIVFAIGFYLGGNFSNAPAISLEKLPEKTLSAKANILAVDSQGKGIVSQASVEINSGSGRILLSLNPFVEPDTQDSAKTAASIAQEFTGKSLSDKDVIYSIENSPASLVGGPSAGAALTLATIAAIQEKRVRSDAAITGTIQADGKIGEVGGVIEKASAAAEKGLKLFVVPKGQKTLTYYEQRQEETRRGNFTITRTVYVPKTIDLQEYLKQEGFEIQVEEVASIQEAVTLMIE
ncbi:MAG TPA: hypothetical protein HA222_02955 [Candidatus Diapherotrites archaeon]|uniref:Lon proteolytic domain-containing protein n=1 Tax=Candidatus Iainarchaeum sp. TaxID=3101447 RepID=A0A7J4KUC2_9ARCH|nr:hypothetical protein [Candidatus Diapherotrites archaeon]HIH33532.1 hypothetical protein [Candidatus Diapherotrites archaeon]